MDRISDVKPLSAPERRAIQKLLDGADDLDDVMERTVRLLSELTNQVAVIQYPQLGAAKVRHIEFVLLAPPLLVVLIADNGKVDQHVAVLPVDVAEDALATLRTAFLAALSGKSLAECRTG